MLLRDVKKAKKKGITSDWYVMGKHKQNFHQHLIHNFLDTSLPWYSQESPWLSVTIITEGDDLLAFSLITFF